jgi:hypothetical protein
MEWFITGLTFLAGILFRLGLPLGVTAGMVWMLLKLDRRWQSEAEVQTALKQHMVRNRGCWDIKHCPASLQINCPVREHLDMPCWQVKRKGGFLEEACLACKVFREAEVPASV